MSIVEEKKEVIKSDKKALTLVKTLGLLDGGKEDIILTPEILNKIAYGSDYALALDFKLMKNVCVYQLPFSCTIDKSRNVDSVLFQHPEHFLKGDLDILGDDDFTEIATVGVKSFEDAVESRKYLSISTPPRVADSSEWQLEFMIAMQDLHVPNADNNDDEDVLWYNPSRFDSEEKFCETLDYMKTHKGERYIGFWQYDAGRQVFTPIYYKVK